VKLGKDLRANVEHFWKHFVKHFGKHFVEPLEVGLGLGISTGGVRDCGVVGFEESSSHKTFGCRHTWLGSKRGNTVKE
jgi:hypothetical protein